MDLRNWEFYTSGSAVVGADVYVYDASLAHPNPNAPLASTVTNSDGMWAFTGLTDTAKDVKVVFGTKAKWYKGLTRHSVGIVFIDDYPTSDFLQVLGQSSVAAPGASTALGRLYMKTDGKLYGRYENGSEYKLADFAGATGVLKAAGWGTIANAEVTAAAGIEGSKIAQACVSLRKTTSQSIATSPTWTTINWADGEYIDEVPSGMTEIHNNSTNTSRFTSPMDGLWFMFVVITFETNAANNPILGLQKNGTTAIPGPQFYMAVPPGGTTYSSVCFSTLFRLAANDYVELRAIHFAGVNVNIGDFGNGCYMHMIYVGGTS